MRLVFLIPSLRAGGAERVFANLLSLWDSESDELHLVLLSREGPYLDQIPKTVTIHDLGGGRFLRAIPRLVGLIRNLSPHAVLVTQAHMNASMGWLRSLIGNVRVVGRETNMPEQVGLARGESPLRRWINRSGYRRLDAVVCPSSLIADELQRLYGLSRNRLAVIPNPIVIERLVAASQEAMGSEPSLPEGGLFLVAVGRLEHNKGFDLLLEAMAFLPSEVRLLLVGEGRLHSELEERAILLGVEDRVTFTGFQANPHQILVRCRVFVLSSRYEGLPNAALEALSLGLPVVAFDGPWGVRDVVEEGITGLLARPFEPKDLARAISDALNKDWDRSAIQAWARNRFDGPSVAQQYREVMT